MGRSGDDGTGLELGRFTELVHATCRALASKADAGAIKLDRGPVARCDAGAIIQSALRHFASYHTRAVLLRKGDRLFANDMKLLLYYSNRLRGYGLEKEMAPLFREGGA
jgi:glycerol-3-phosphate O-acyltransferase